VTRALAFLLPAIALTMPSPATNAYERGDREKLDASCKQCHAAAARDHEASLHRASFTDASFQRGYVAEPQAFCRSCHAPESRPNAEPDAFARDRGVTCVTCHVPKSGGAVLAGPRARPSGVSAPHEIARVPDLGTRACASCHEFAFPGAEQMGERGLMQSTMTEHARALGDLAARACADCHMRRGDDARASHGFAASRDPAALARAIDVVAARGADGRLVFTLTSREIGHAFPTGDLFRRLVLRVKTRHTVIEQPFGRTFRAERTPDARSVRRCTSDTRIEGSRTLELPIDASEPVSWELVYQRVTGVEQAPPFRVDVEAETRLHAGVL
jgi:hypothetical protein